MLGQVNDVAALPQQCMIVRPSVFL
jgi:hypothetical protein